MFKKRLRIYIVVFLSLIIVLWIFRNVFLQPLLSKIVTRAEEKFEIEIQYDQARLKGFRNIHFTNLNIKTTAENTIVHADSFIIGVKPFSLLFSKIRFSTISLYNSEVVLNYELLQYLKSHGRSGKDSLRKQEINYAKTLNNLKNTFFRLLPEKILLRNCRFSYMHDSIEATVTFENFSLRNNKFISDILFHDKEISSECLVEGKINPSKDEVNFKVSHSGDRIAQLPYLGPRWHACFGFDTLQISCKINKYENQDISFSGTAKADKLSIYYKQIGPDTVVTNTGTLSYKFNFGQKYWELDSTSVIQINRFSFSPYLHFIKKDTSAIVTIAFIEKEFNAEDLFSSLPKGLFTNFSGFKTDGKLSFRMKTTLDLGIPDSSKFDANLINKGFRIKKYGVTDFRLMNNSFYHEIYENDRLVNGFMVGPENPDFVPYGEISPYLKYSVLTSEDGDFFYHNGFNQRAFSESIAENIKKKRFARGGSTITMQLVKNVFLSKKKNISRKIEEALIVWIIENLNLSGKERMFEVYLNIIEWGPGVYGIKPAARFYFNKRPADLNLSESIYLTSLIPRPKGFKYTFDKNGKIRDYLVPYYQLLSSIMLRRNQITESDTTGLKPVTELTGEAEMYLSKPDSATLEDSLFYQQPDFFPTNGIK